MDNVSALSIPPDHYSARTRYMYLGTTRYTSTVRLAATQHRCQYRPPACADPSRRCPPHLAYVLRSTAASTQPQDQRTKIETLYNIDCDPVSRFFQRAAIHDTIPPQTYYSIPTALYRRLCRYYPTAVPATYVAPTAATYRVPDRLQHMAHIGTVAHIRAMPYRTHSDLYHAPTLWSMACDDLASQSVHVCAYPQCCRMAVGVTVTGMVPVPLCADHLPEYRYSLRPEP